MQSTELQALATPLRETVWRVVETQETAATAAITSSHAEQSRLESLLDNSKPRLSSDLDGLSYLLFTPFRYPPLPYGSRYGSQFERGILYAALSLRVAFAESAVYLWLFRSGPVDTGPLTEIRDQRSSYSIPVVTQCGLRLSDEPLSGLRPQLTRADDWSHSQRFGTRAREAGIDALQYPSCRIDGDNMAVFEPRALGHKRESNLRSWHMVLDAKRCWFGATSRDDSFEFSYEQFSQQGKIPHPAL